MTIDDLIKEMKENKCCDLSEQWEWVNIIETELRLLRTRISSLEKILYLVAPETHKNASDLHLN